MSIVTVTTEQVHELIQQLAAQTVAASITPEMVANIFEKMRQLNDQEKDKIIAITNAYLQQLNEAGIVGFISREITQSEENEVVFETDNGTVVGAVGPDGADFTNLKRGGQQVARMSDLPTKDSSIGNNPSNSHVPTTKAVKDYVDAHSGDNYPIDTETTSSEDEEQVWGNNEETQEYAKIGSYGMKSKAYLDMQGQSIIDGEIGNTPSTSHAPSAKAVKDYVDAHGGGTGDLPIDKTQTSEHSQVVEVTDDEDNIIGKYNSEGILYVNYIRSLNGKPLCLTSCASPNLYSIEDADVECEWTKTEEKYTNTNKYGIANKLLVNREFAITDRVVVWDFIPDEVGIYYFGMYPSQYNLQARARSVAFVDLSRGKIGSLQQVASNEQSPDTMTEISSESNITGYANLQGVPLRIFVKKNECKLQRLDTLDFIGSNAVVGYMFERPFCFASVQMTLLRMVVNGKTTENYNTYAMVFGDSITEGAGASNKDNAYAYLTATALGNSLVSGRSGGNILNVIERLKTEAVNLRPRYVIVGIGTNGGNTKERLRILIDLILSIGASPIINHIPMQTNKNTTASVNNQIDEVIAEYLPLKIPCAKMDVATAINEDPSQGQDTSLFSSDLVHPNDTGHRKMFLRIFKDIPNLFNDIYNITL